MVPVTSGKTARPCRAHLWAVMALGCLMSAAAAQDALQFEVENYTTPKDAWRVNKPSKDKWNLWSTDKDAMRKWSGGIVFQSPLVMEDRGRPEDGAPVLHTHITGIPNGKYVVMLTTVGRGLAVSFDGKTWVKKTDTSLGMFTIADGTFDLWVDDRYALAKSPGSTYYDAIVFTPVIEAKHGALNGDFESKEGTAAVGWAYWSREGKGSARVAEDEKRGGKRSVLIEHSGERDWAYTNSAMLAVEPKQIFTISAWVKSEVCERVELAVVAYAGGKRLRWSIGSCFSGGKHDWTRIRQAVRVPAGCEQVQLRFVGNKATKIWVDDVALKPGMEPRAQRPKVQGYAKQRVAERLGRGLVAMPIEGQGVYLGWRLLESDPKGVAFNVYRQTAGAQPMRLNKEPIRKTTDFVDTTAPANKESQYHVRPVVQGREAAASEPAGVTPSGKARHYVSIPLNGDHKFQKVGIADLNGDGRYDFVIKQPEKNIDPAGSYWYKSPDTYKLEAYTSDGKFLWRYDLGWSIERGIWYSPYIVYDFDGDGRAEVAVKTGEGDPREEDGRVKEGPEHLSILDGMTGRERCRVDWPSREGIRNYNLQSRNQICMAYLDGKTPCLIVGRGTYGTMKLVAYQLVAGKLQEVWRWDNRDEPGWYRAQGAHIMHAADVDGDGRDEVVIGSAVVDDNGVGLWATGYGHPDFCFVGDIDPGRPGLEVFYGIEPRRQEHALCLVDAKTGEVIWGLKEPTNHVGTNGMCADIDMSHPGLECHAADIDKERKFAKSWLFSAQGKLIEKDVRGGIARVVYWDADPQKELVRGSRIVDYRGGEHPPRIEGSVITFADILGDWREEIIVSLPGELRVYTTGIPALDRRVCLMQDPIYRIDVAVAAMGYWAAPMLSYCPASQSASVSLRLDGSTLRPQGPTPGEVIVVAPAGKALVGRLEITCDALGAVSPARASVDLAPGAMEKVPIQVRATRAADPLAGQRSVRLRAVLHAQSDTLRAEVYVPQADVPIKGAPTAQAEDFAAQGGGKVQTRADKLGSVGKAISHWDDAGHWLEWKIGVPAAGKYHMVVRYCAPHVAVREVRMDGKSPAGPKALSFPSSGGFGDSGVSHWTHLAARDDKGGLVAYELAAGTHTVRLINTNGKGLNLDYVAFVPASVRAAKR